MSGAWGAAVKQRWKIVLESEVFASRKKTPGASQVAQLVKNLPAMQETLVQFLGWEDPLEK